ncbi:autotransporter domain-containing protein, partial [Phyllobacterium phragmitis]
VVNANADTFVASFSGSTGTLNIGNGGAAGTLNSASVNFGNGTGSLNFNHTETAYDFGAAISGAGTLNHLSGATNLTADSSGFTGTTNITSGTLSVNNTLGGAVNVTGGTLGGSGTLSGDVAVTNGAIAAGNSPGMLTIGGDLTLASGSSLNFELGSPSGTAGVDSDLINVGENLTLDGTLNVSNAGGFGSGLYRLVNYDGTLTDNGLEIGAAPSGFNANNLTVQTAMANQVNLLVGAPFVSFWDGANTIANNAVDGGAGTWSATGNNWTLADGSANGAFEPSVLLIFAGTPGTVTVDDSAGAIGIQSGMQFAVDGYNVIGDAIGLTGANVVRVGDGTATGAGFTATIASNLTGAGSLEKTDLGTLVLTGANTYTGGTTISAGTLIGNATSLQGNIVNNAALTFDQASAGTYAGAISGSGALTKDGAGALTLTGANTYTGGTTISAGTLIGNATSLQGDIANNAALTFDQGTAGTFAGVISGTGALTKVGAGALTLTSANAYTGGTTVSAGTLIGNTTSLQGNIANNAALTFDQASAGTYAGVVSGTGSLTKSGAGALTLTGANSYTGGTTISAGTLIGNTVSLQGDIANNAALTFDQGTAGTYAGIVSGSGALTKAGTGQLTLTGDSSAYTGTTAVTAGLLTVNGSLGGATNLSGGTLGGSGTLGNVTIASGGTLAPGNSIGTLNVANVTFNAGSTYTVELNDGGFVAGTNNDLLNATGTASILGGTVHVTPENGTDTGTTYTDGATYTILTATGGVTGTFDTVTDDYAFLDFTQSSDPNNVFLTSVLIGGGGGDVDVDDGNACATLGLTSNQNATCGGVLSIGSGSLHTALINLSNAEAPIALDRLSGELHASTKTALIDDSRFAREVALDRLRVAFGGTGAGAGQATRETPEGATLWAQGFGVWSHWNGDGNAAPLDRSIGGLFMGADAEIADNVTLGLMGGYSHSSLDLDDRASSATVDSYTLGAYAGGAWDAFSLKGGVAHSWHSLDTSRSVAFAGFSDSLSASYNARTFQAYTEAAYSVEYGKARFEPFANLAYVHLNTDGYTESGGDAALTASGSSSNATFTTLGIRGETQVYLGGLNARLSGGLGWRHAFGDTPTATQSFSAGGDAFTVTGVPLARDTLVLDAGFTLDLTDSATLGLSYNGQLGSGLADHSAKASLNVRF